MISKNSRFTSLQLLVFAITLLFFGFLLGSLHYDVNFFSFAQDSNKSKYEPDQEIPTDRPDKAIETARTVEKAFSYVSNKAKPAVVTIFTRKKVSARGFPFPGPRGNDQFDEFFRRFFDAPKKREVTGLGSGMILRSDGYILTNQHVVAKADEIEVRLNNQESAKAEIVGSDKESDLAVLKIDRSGLPSLDFANSNNVRVGDYAIAIGAPFQMKNSVSVGHVSAMHRAINVKRFEDLIQTDAAINQGNSGGPLINIEGDVIGINTLILSQGSRGSQGVGFAISANLAERTAEDLIEFGKVKRPWLGVVIQQIDSEMAEKLESTSGVIVSEVKDGSPADQAGLSPGDVILEFNGQSVKTPHDLQRLVLAQQIGDQVTVTVQKKAEDTRELNVELAELPGEGDETAPKESEPSQEKDMAEQLGLKLNQLDKREARERGITPARPVVQVQDVQRGSLAAKAKIQPGDFILAFGRFGEETVTSVDEFNDILSQLKERGEDKVFVHLSREGSNILTMLPLRD